MLKMGIEVQKDGKYAGEKAQETGPLLNVAVVRTSQRPANDNWPLVLTRTEAATLCKISTRTFDLWIRKEILPGPIPGTRRWSRVAIEQALMPRPMQSEDSQHSPFGEWKCQNAH